MGTWGSGPFDNDDAADWAWQLTPEADEGVVAAALTPGAERAPGDAAVIAAAEVVAAGVGRPHPELPDEVAAWVAGRRDLGWTELVGLAVAAVERLRGGSELADLWAEPDDDAWAHEVDDLLDRLRGNGGPHSTPH
jgi:hypothetical protein